MNGVHDIRYTQNIRFLFPHASNDIWPRILREIDQKSAAMLLQVSRASHKIAIPWVYRHITIASRRQANAIALFFDRRSTETLCGGKGECHMVEAITLGETQEIVYDEDDYPTLDYHALYQLLRCFTNTRRFIISQIDFPYNLLLPILRHWPTIRMIRIRNVADCVFEDIERDEGDQEQTAPSAVRAPTLSTVDIEGRLELMGGFGFLCVIGKVLQMNEVENLVVDWVTYADLHCFLNVASVVLTQLSSITLMPLSPLHPWQEYLRTPEGTSLLRRGPLTFAPNLNTTQSFRNHIVVSVRGRTPILRYQGPLINLRQLVELDLGYWAIRDLVVYSTTPSNTITISALSSTFPHCPYSPLTALSVEDFHVSTEDNATSGSLFPSLDRLFLWTTQEISIDVSRLAWTSQRWL
ncbi:hypothetical protein PQX77_003136 [Marasmius sp. AFHP31]|nr:hypothetical protein PQX77_003136 [Marasmius sp. AFHP31]